MYEEVEADTTATQQAVVVVGVIAVAQGLGTAALGLSGILIGITAALLGWPIWSGITYLIGDKLPGGTATWGELLRTLGFAQSPGVLGVFALLPAVGGVVRFGITSMGAARGLRGSSGLYLGCPITDAIDRTK